MALTNSLTRRIDLPHEPGEWIEVRLPSYRVLQAARDARLRAAIEQVRGIDLATIQSFSAGQSRARTPDPLDEYDLPSLLAECVVAWSYSATVTPQAIDSLDEQTAKLLGRALLPVQSEEERTDGFFGSTAPSTATEAIRL